MEPSEKKKLLARASLLANELNANEQENRFMQQEYDDIYAKIDKAKERAERKAQRKEDLARAEIMAKKHLIDF